MEMIIFAFVIAFYFTKNGVEDLVHAAKGTTSPRHERKMRALDVADRALNNRGSKAGKPSKKPSRVRAHVGVLADDAFERAAERRRIRHEVRNPRKAEEYRQKIQRREAKRAERNELRSARKQVAPTATPRHPGDLWDVADFPTTPRPESTDTTTPPGSADSSTDGSTGGDTGEGLVDEAQPNGDSGRPNTADTTPASGSGSTPEHDSGLTTGTAEPTPAAELSTATNTDGANPAHIKEGTTMAATGETTSLSTTLASLSAWKNETEQGMTSLENSIANLSGSEVGPGVTGALARAQEAFATAVAAFAEAEAALQPSQQIGDMYSASPDAGSKDFVTS